MTILIGDGGNVDFDMPLTLTPQQRAGLVAFLETQFKVVETRSVTSFREDRLGMRFFAREWTVKELAQLFDWRVPQEETARRLGRTAMSVQMQAGNFTPGFLAWCRDEHKDPARDDVEQLIALYLAHQDLAKVARRQARLEQSPARLRKKLAAAEQLLASQQLLARARGGADADINSRVAETKAAIEELRGRLATEKS